MDKKYRLIFEKYMRSDDPDKRRNCIAWQTAIGLQAVDGLHVSEVFLNAVIKNIEGELSINEVQSIIDSYYNRQGNGQSQSEET